MWVGVHGRPEGLVATALLWLLVIAVSLALAAVAYHCVERPLERRLRRAGPQPRASGERAPRVPVA